MSTNKAPIILEWSTAGVAAAGGVLIALVGASYGLTNVTGVGAGFFPTIAGILVAISGVMWLVQLAATRRTNTADDAAAAPASDTLDDPTAAFDADDQVDEDGEEDVVFPDRQGWIRVGIIVASIFAAALLLPVLGYTISMTLMLAVVLFFVSKRKWWLSLAVGLAAALLSRLVFEVWLGTVLPTSSIDFLAMIGV
jgi:hypothetical protein